MRRLEGTVLAGSRVRQGIPLTAIAMGTGGATAIGVLAGVYPSVRAARLAPTEALSTA
ncbi:hypothetical protein AB4Z54_19775 [Streptomyces sp. MCAF7]